MAAAFTACSASDEATDNPYRAEFEAALERATSDFEREVLSDFEITRAEYEEAIERYVQCASDHGVELDAVPQGGYYIFRFPASDESEVILDQCGTGTIAEIGTLYVDILRNPNNEDMPVLLVSCLIETGLASPDYTVDEFLAGREASPPDFPFDVDDPRFGECLANPSGSAGAVGGQ